MRNAVVDVELHHLGVDHQELHFIRAGPEQYAGNDGVDADAFPGACGAGHQQVGHLGQVRHDGLAADILPQGEGQLGFRLHDAVGFQHLPQGDHADGLVGHLDAHGGLAGDGGHDPHLLGGQVQGDIVRQADDAAHLHPRAGLQLIPGDGGAAADLHHLGLDAEVGQGFLQQSGVGQHFLLVLLGVVILRLGQKLRGGQLVIGPRLFGDFQRRQLLPFGGFRLRRAGLGLRSGPGGPGRNAFDDGDLQLVVLIDDEGQRGLHRVLGGRHIGDALGQGRVLGLRTRGLVKLLLAHQPHDGVVLSDHGAFVRFLGDGFHQAAVGIRQHLPGAEGRSLHGLPHAGQGEGGGQHQNGQNHAGHQHIGAVDSDGAEKDAGQQGAHDAAPLAGHTADMGRFQPLYGEILRRQMLPLGQGHHDEHRRHGQQRSHHPLGPHFGQVPVQHQKTRDQDQIGHGVPGIGEKAEIQLLQGDAQYSGGFRVQADRRQHCEAQQP